MAADKSFLDALSLGGCGHPGCTHSTHTVWLHAKCHLDATVGLAWENGILELHCGECGKLIIHVQAPKRVSVYPCKIHGALLYASYTYGSGIVKITCKTCKKVLGQFRVSEEKHEHNHPTMARR